MLQVYNILRIIWKKRQTKCVGTFKTQTWYEIHEIYMFVVVTIPYGHHHDLEGLFDA
jgi:hypothetical protein